MCESNSSCPNVPGFIRKARQKAKARTSFLVRSLTARRISRPVREITAS